MYSENMPSERNDPVDVNDPYAELNEELVRSAGIMRRRSIDMDAMQRVPSAEVSELLILLDDSPRHFQD